MKLKDLELFEHSWNQFTQAQYSGQDSVHAAMTYAMSGEGKRVRALACLQTAREYGADPRLALSGAVAVEMIHTYSLCHDDLPCMDNDDWRRGRPSLHKAFDEATALLAGDALLTDAFRVLTDSKFFPDNGFVSETAQARQVSLLSRAAGGHGMVLGQARDLWWTGRGDISEDALDAIHLGKTGALMGASFAIGAAAAGAPKDDIERWMTFGRMIGLAFQAIDDTLDATEGTGKSSGKDAAQGKLTYLRFHTKSQILDIASKLTNDATAQLPYLPSRELSEFVGQLLTRKK